MPRRRSEEPFVDVVGESPTEGENEEHCDNGGNMGPPPSRSAGEQRNKAKKSKSSKVPVAGSGSKLELCDDDVRFVNEGVNAIKDNFKWLHKCATTVMGGMAGKEVNKRQFKQTVNKFRNAGLEITELKLKLEGAVKVAGKAIKNFDMKAVEGMDDEKMLEYLDKFETDTLKDYDNWCKKSVGMKQVVKDVEYKLYAEEINNIIKGKDDPEIPTPDDEKVHPLPVEDLTMSEGLEALNEYIPSVDPVTRKKFRDPVINRLCGHIYDYESIINLIITSNGRSKCPYPGCGNRQGVKQEDLERNEEIRTKVFKRMEEEYDQS